LNMTSGLEKLAKADDTTIVVVVKAEKDGKLRVTQSPPRVAARRKPRLGVAREDRPDFERSDFRPPGAPAHKITP
jgi:hypothetical protein